MKQINKKARRAIEYENLIAPIMYGTNVIHIPFFGTVQDQGDDKSLMMFATANKEIRFGSVECHQFILGDMIIRPHYVGETNVLRGLGANGIITTPPWEIIPQCKKLIAIEDLKKLYPQLKF